MQSGKKEPHGIDVEFIGFMVDRKWKRIFI